MTTQITVLARIPTRACKRVAFLVFVKTLKIRVEKLLALITFGIEMVNYHGDDNEIV